MLPTALVVPCRLAAAGLRAYPRRLLLTATAIVLGVGFLAGTLVYGDTARAAFFDDLARSARHVDVLVGPAGVDFFAETSRRVDFSSLDTVRTLPGVARADGRIAERLPMLDGDGRLIANFGKVGWALSTPGTPSLAPYDLVAGRLPRAGSGGEIAVDRATVAEHGFAPGRPVTVLGADRRPAAFTLVGVVDLGANRRFGGVTVAVLADPELRRLVNPQGYAEIAVTAAPGTGQAALARRVSAALGGRPRVRTGDAVRHDLAVSAAKYVDGFQLVLVTFGLVALAVCGFVIHNTFAILVAQRTRELALLRCVGASRRQVFGLVLAESAVIGAVGSAGGLLLSVVIGYGLLVGRGAVGNGVPAHGLVLAPGTVALAGAVGVGATVLAALSPAVIAGRVPPMAALRVATLGGPTSGRPGRMGRRRLARLGLAAVLAGAGSAVMAVGVPRAFGGTPIVFAGAVLLLAGVVVASPVVVAPLTGLIGALPARLGAATRLGVAARLATANARRSPGRVAATTSALVIGLALMSMISVLLATVRVQARRELAENFPVDYVVTGVYVTGRVDSVQVPLAAAAALRSRPELAAAAGCRLTGATVAGRAAQIWAAEPGALTGPLRPEVTAGALPGAPAVGEAALNRFFAAEVRVGVGDRVTVALGDAEPLSVTVVALYDDAPVAAPVLLAWPDYAALAGPGEADRLLVRAADGVPPPVARAAVETALRPYPLAQVNSLADGRARLTGTLDHQLGVFAALLGMSILIGLCGIANTLSLSVVERAWESALLRALGLSRGQLRAMLVVEALLMAVVGGLIGVGLGALVGAVASIGLIRAYGHGAPVVPFAQLALYVGLAALAGAVAGVLPARRAARAPVATVLAGE